MGIPYKGYSRYYCKIKRYENVVHGITSLAYRISHLNACLPLSKYDIGLAILFFLHPYFLPITFLANLQYLTKSNP